MKKAVPALAGFIVGLVAGGAVLAVAVSSKRADVSRGWNLRPIVVAAVDVSDGQKLTFDMISQRSLPEQFVSASNVLPDQASVVIGHAVTSPLQAGDPLTWQAFSAVDSRVRDCAKQISADVLAAGDAVRDRAAAKFAEGLDPVKIPVVELRVVAEPVVRAAQDIPEGTVLTAAMLKSEGYAAELLTGSLIPGDRIQDLVGVRIAVPMQKGDALMWQLLDSGRRPRSLRSCELAVAEEAHQARVKAAAQEVEKLP